MPALALAAVALAAAACAAAAGSPRASTTTSPSTTSTTTSTVAPPTTSTSTTTLPATTTTTTVPPVETPTLTAAVLTASQTGARPYTVSCAHPVLSGAPGAGAIDATLASTVSSAVTWFENYVDGSAPLPDGAGPSTLTCTWSHAWLSPTLGSVSFTATDFLGGAAHPFATITTFSFDPATGKVYTLADLFRSGSNWLQVITDEAHSLLPAVLGPHVTPLFPAPTQAKDFAAFQFGAGGLLITFQEYEVAPYAWGTPTITIPYAALASVADPAGPLASMTTLGS